MTPARRLLLAVLLLAVGFFVVPLVRELFPSPEKWERQLEADAETALQVLRPDARIPADLSEIPGFWERWDERLGLYDEAHRLELRRRLRLYLEVVVAEHEEAAEVWVSGTDPRRTSEALRALHAELRQALGPVADAVVDDGRKLREAAYAASPTHSGLDPDAPDYRTLAEAIHDWRPVAEARVTLLTTPRDERPR